MCVLFQYDDEDDEIKLAEQEEQQQRQNYALQPAGIPGTAPDKDGTISGMLADFSRSIGSH